MAGWAEHGLDLSSHVSLSQHSLRFVHFYMASLLSTILREWILPEASISREKTKDSRKKVQFYVTVKYKSSESVALDVRMTVSSPSPLSLLKLLNISLVWEYLLLGNNQVSGHSYQITSTISGISFLFRSLRPRVNRHQEALPPFTHHGLRSDLTMASPGVRDYTKAKSQALALKLQYPTL